MNPVAAMIEIMTAGLIPELMAYLEQKNSSTPYENVSDALINIPIRVSISRFPYLSK